MWNENTDIRDLLDLPPEDVAGGQRSAALDLAAAQKDSRPSMPLSPGMDNGSGGWILGA